MRRGAGSGPGSESVGILDAGVVLTSLDRRRRRHREVRALLDRCALRQVTLWISAVNLAEALGHAAPYTKETGVDLVALLASFGVGVHRPDVDVARRAADLARLKGASLGDRFAVATADLLKGRLYTTDGALAAAIRKQRIALTVF